VDGINLLTTVKLEVARVSGTGEYIKPSWWSALKLKFDIRSRVEGLEVKTPSEELDASLVAALEVATTTNSVARSKTLLVSWMETTPDINQRGYCGLAKYLLSLKAGSEASSPIFISMMKCVVRLDLSTKFPEEPWGWW
jgi:hypothetical protein